MNADGTERWLRDLYGSPMLDDLTLTVCWRGDGRLRFRHWPTNEIDGAAGFVSRMSNSTCMWVGCLPLAAAPARGRGGAADTGALIGLWADIDVAGPGHKHPDDAEVPLPADIDAALLLLDGVRRPPTKLLHTGGGLQAWWLFGEPWLFDDDADRAEAGALVGAWGDTLVELGLERGVHVDQVGDLARILRPAGTWNRKPNRQPVQVRTLVDDGPHYLVADLEDSLVPAWLSDPKPKRPSTANATADPFSRPSIDSPADVFNRHVTWAELLEPHGWRRFTHPNGAPALGTPCPKCGARVEMWSHGDVDLDHRGRPDHVSATACHVLYVFSLSKPSGLPSKQPLTRFRCWSLLDFGGDMSAAARRLVKRSRGVSRV